MDSRAAGSWAGTRGSRWLLALTPGCLRTRLGGQMHRATPWAARTGSTYSSISCTHQCGERRAIALLCPTGSEVTCGAEHCKLSLRCLLTGCTAVQAFSATSYVGAGMSARSSAPPGCAAPSVGKQRRGSGGASRTAAFLGVQMLLMAA